MLVTLATSKYMRNEHRMDTENVISRKTKTNSVSDSNFNNLRAGDKLDIKKSSAKKYKKEYELKKPDHEIGHHKKK